MPDSASNPFAEPDFSSIQPAGGDAEADDEEIDDDAEDIDDETEDIDDDFEDEELDEVLDEEDVDDDEPEIEVTTAIVPGAEMDEDGAGNRVAGGTARSVLEHVARSIVDDPDGVVVDVSESRSGIHLALHVAQSDMGRIIGRRGRTAQALRTLVRAAAARDSQEASVDIVD